MSSIERLKKFLVFVEEAGGDTSKTLSYWVDWYKILEEGDRGADLPDAALVAHSRLEFEHHTFTPCDSSNASEMVGSLYHELLCTMEDSPVPETNNMIQIALSHLVQAKMFFAMAHTADRRP